MRTRRLPVAAGRIGDLESDTDPSMLATGEHLTTRRFAVAGDEDGDGWDQDEGPGPDWQPRPMTGAMPIFGDESYPRASDSSDAEQTDAGASTTSSVTNVGATVAAEGSSEDSVCLRQMASAPRTVRFRRDRRVSALDNRRSPCALRDR